MKKLSELADRLNDLLKSSDLDKGKFDEIWSELSEFSGLRLRLIDLELYNGKALEGFSKEKVDKIKEQNFEAAAKAREQEKECFKHVNFQRYFKIKNSFFYPEEDKLFYFHLGTERNDEILKNIFSADFPIVKVPRVEKS